MAGYVKVICFLLICVISIDSRTDGEHFQHWRPRLFPDNIEDQLKYDVSKYKLYRKNFESNKEVGDYLIMMLLDFTPMFDTTLEKLITLSFDTTHVLNDQRDQCNNSMQDAEAVRKTWRELKEKARDGDEMCPICPLLFDIMRVLVCNVDFIPARDLLIWACEWLLPLVDSHAGMCEGVITLQAPYVFTTLKEATSYDFCETLNMCYPPPKTNTPSVHQKLSRILDPQMRIDLEKDKLFKTNNENSQKQLIKFVQMTDVHVQPIYSTGSAIECDMYVCCTDQVSGKGEARMYGEYRCNLPERTMMLVFDQLRDIDPDFIVLSGDAPPHTIWDETLMSQLNCSDKVRKALMEKVPGKIVYPNIGNHEMYPTNVYSTRVNFTNIMNEAFTEMWKDLAGFGPEQEDTMKYMGYYSIQAANYTGLRILSLNFNHYWYNLNFMATVNRNTTDEANQRRFTIDTLTQARQNGEKVIVVAHHPVGTSSSIVRATRWWEQVALEFHDVILMFLSGHTHKDEYHLILEPETLKPVSINYVAPSVTTNTDINPSLKVYHLDPTTFALEKTEHFYLDLDQQAPNSPPPVVKNDDIMELYGMEDLSLNSWLELSIRFFEDDALFQTWYRNRFARAVDTKCDGECKARLICAIWFPNVDEIDECVKIMMSLPPPTVDTSGATCCIGHVIIIAVATICTHLLL